MRIVFFGTSEFACTILEYLIFQKATIMAVVTRPDKARGRSSQLAFSAVKQLALSKQLPLYQPIKASDPDFANFLKTLNADFFIVAAYAEILKENILEIPRLSCLNVHGSILPKYRGAAPIQRSIIAGEQETGVTIMKMALQMDAGDILAIKKTPIPFDMNAAELMKILADLGKVALWEVMQEMEQGIDKCVKQDSDQVTFAKKITTADAEINWNNSCITVHNQIRGVNPNPGAWCWVEIQGEKKRLLIKKSYPHPSLHGQPKDIVSQNSHELVVGCSQGSVSLIEVQLEGKKNMSVDLFLRGVSLNKIKFI